VLPSSDHLRAMAADFKAPAFGTPLEVCRALEPHLDELGIGQLIHEFGTWVHASTRRPDREVNRILTISHAGTLPGIVAVS
jgi:zinc D-Ala-D-Ala carboxypeptidase